MNVNLTEYDIMVILQTLEDYVFEHGSQDWPVETKDAIKGIFQKLGANEYACRYIGGILK